jgi:hypothetical protein
MKVASKTCKWTGDEEDMTEFDAACARIQDLRGGFKALHRIKYDLYIEGIESGMRSDRKGFLNLQI